MVASVSFWTSRRRLRAWIGLAGVATALAGCGASPAAPVAAPGHPAAVSTSAAPTHRPPGSGPAPASTPTRPAAVAPSSKAPQPNPRASTSPAAAALRATPGTYSGHTTGQQNAGFGSQPVDEDDQLVVSNRTNDWQDDTLSDSDQTNDTVVRFVGDTVELSFLRIKTGLFDVSFHMPRPVLALGPASAGTTPWSWSATSDDGKTSATFSGHRSGTDVLTVAGRQVRCVRILATLKLSGSVTLNVDITDDYDPASHVDVLIRDNATGHVGALDFSSDTTHRLTSLTPEQQ